MRLERIKYLMSRKRKGNIIICESVETKIAHYNSHRTIFNMKNLYYFSLYFLLTVACTQKEQEVITFKENGSWCWFQDERAIIHNNQLIFGSVADRYGKNGEELDGNIE